jgi:hypothetical protein
MHKTKMSYDLKSKKTNLEVEVRGTRGSHNLISKPFLHSPDRMRSFLAFIFAAGAALASAATAPEAFGLTVSLLQ